MKNIFNNKLDIPVPFEEGKVMLKCVKLNQPLGQFFVGGMTREDLVKITYSDVRRIEEERDFETFLGIQRPLKKSRIEEIKNYVETVDACFPTAIVLSVSEKCAEYDEETMTLTLSSYKSQSEVDNENDEFDEDISLLKVAKVIDGQHRIAGLDKSTVSPFDVNVSIFVEIDVSSEAYIFSTVNMQQSKINSSLLYDLYDLAGKRSPQKLCHQIAVALNDLSGSPFENRIKRLGVATPKTEPTAITQAAFVNSLMRYISKKPLKDRDVYLKNKKPVRYEGKDKEKYIFRDLFIDERDYDLTDIIWNYFSAISERWPIAWVNNDKGVMIRKTNGFMAFMRFLGVIYPKINKVVPNKEDFNSYLQKVRLDDEDFNTDRFKPGSSGEAELLKILKSSLD
ncbi:DGQHR domain-containing protein [Vreelandella venusta]|uniref:DGQHR domain-containing protein n=1 Tax=Vreelandella venusta TaxID=44935 RepID=UPI00200D2B39|nr:DGQHR domain-containing protein [Halomonas venusta]UQI40950.1 DGQHR domain-containing protein [Halomonas venusta]